MAVTTSLDSTSLVVTPGEQVACVVQIRNTGSLVDQFTLDVVGDAKGWTQVEPAVVNLMPGGETAATVTFQPPRVAEIPAGPVPFGVKVSSQEDPTGSVVHEGVLEIRPFTAISVELLPTTSYCRRRAMHNVVVDNAGNHPVAANLEAIDRNDRLRLRLNHQSLTIEPGMAAYVRLTAAPVRRFLRGPEQRHPFQVIVDTDSNERINVDGTVVQQQLLPKWLLPLLLALLGLVVAAVALWFALLKPTVTSTAREAAAQQVAEAAAGQPEQPVAPGGQADSAEAGGTGEPGPGGDSKQQGDGNVQPPRGGPIPGKPIAFRISAKADVKDPPGFMNFEQDPPPPAGTTLTVTDVVLLNPFGDGGIVHVKRGNEVLLEAALNNFHQLKYHHLEPPWKFAPGQRLVLSVNCERPTRDSCRPSALFFGRQA